MLRNLLAVVPAAFLTLSAVAGDSSWIQLADTLVARQEVAVTTDGSRIYLLGGIEEGGGGTAEVYDPGTNSWAFISPLPKGLHHSAAVAVGGSIYLIGGYRAGGFVATAEVFRYDRALGAWSQVASLPQPRGAHTAVTIDGLIYVTGGVPLDGRLLIYDPASDRWTEGAQLPTPREHLTSAALGGRMYVIGGRFSFIASIVSNVEVYDPWLDRWESRARLPTARAGIAAAVLFGRIYVFGGEGNRSRFDGVFPQTESYDPVRDTWRTEPHMPFPRHGIGAAALGNRIHIPSGAPVEGFSRSRHHDALVVDPPERESVPRRRPVRRPR